MEEPNTERRAQSSTVKFDEMLQKLLAVVCFWLLQKLASLQDVLLSFAVFRKAAAYGLAPRCQHTVLHAVQSPDKISSSFDELEYYISEDAQELLMHAALHGLVASSSPQLSHSSIQLPNLGRILLQTATKNSALYQESVAAALAKRLKADFLVIDDVLLSSVAKAAFGSSIDKAEQQEDLGKLLNFILSIWFSGKLNHGSLMLMIQGICDPQSSALNCFAQVANLPLSGILCTAHAALLHAHLCCSSKTLSIQSAAATSGRLHFKMHLAPEQVAWIRLTTLSTLHLYS